MVQISPLDKKLLRAIQKRADISQAALAEQIGSSPASCWRRIKSLEETGVLGPIVRLLNPIALGKKLDAICHVRLKSQGRDSRTSFETFIEHQEEVLECLSTTGEWDYQMRIVVSDMEAYEDLLMRHILSHSSVATSSSQFALKRIKYTTALPI